MGPRLATLALLTTVGCSKLYDPDRLPEATDAPRPPPDVDACQMEVTELETQIFFEGTGDGGSHPGVLVITGKNLVNQTTTVMFKPVEGTTKTPKVEIDNTAIKVGTYGEQLAVPVRFPVDPMLSTGESIVFDVTVAQDCIEGQKTGTIAGKLVLSGLPELTAVPPGGLVSGVSEYSQIKITAGTFTIAAGATEPIILRSRSSVEITPAISVSAPGQAGGPGGGRGGNGGNADLLNPGPGLAGTGPSPGQPSGGAAGFSSMDPTLTTLGAPNRGSGGAGGNGSTSAKGGNGGGGGGSIEITAAGNLTVGAVSAAGAPPSGGGNMGGGGSGGVILLRAGGDLTSGAISVAGGGAGASGLVRHDAGGTVMGSISGHFRGPMFVTPPRVAQSKNPEITVSGKPLSTFRYFLIRESGTSDLVDGNIGAGGTARIMLDLPLEAGASQLCLVPSPGTAISETRNCIDIAYVE